MADIQNWVGTLVTDRIGATAVEYGIMVALIAVAIIITVALPGSALNDAFASVQICAKKP